MEYQLAPSMASSLSMPMATKCIFRKATCNTLEVPPPPIGSLPTINGIIWVHQQGKIVVTLMLTATFLVLGLAVGTMAIYITNLTIPMNQRTMEILMMDTVLMTGQTSIVIV